MHIFIPSTALQSAMLTGSVVYLVINTTGEITGILVSKTTIGLATAIGSLVGVVSHPIAGVITHEIINNIGNSYFVPAIRSGGKFTAIGLSIGAGVVTGLVVTIIYHGGNYVIQKMKNIATPQTITEIDFNIKEDEDDYLIVSRNTQIKLQIKSEIESEIKSEIETFSDIECIPL